MIIYEPNKNFFGGLYYWAKSKVMLRLTFAVIGIGLFTAAFAFVLTYFHIIYDLPENLGAIFSFLGIVLSILLVFRTNSAYDRWWEGRKLLGSLVNNCRNLAVQTHSFLPKDDKLTRHRMAVLISNFCTSLKDHLRKKADPKVLIELTEEQLIILQSKKNIPNEISSQIHQLLVECRKNGRISDFDLLNFKPHTQALLDILGACERIKKTPIPFSYEIFIKMYVLIYCFLLPVTMVPMFGYMAIPFVMLVFFAFMGLEMMAAEIEEPFGEDENDLPTGQIVKAISDDVFEILEATNNIANDEKQYEIIN